MPLMMDSSDEPLVRKASVAVADLIRAAIIGGDLEPGERVKEDELARTLKVSRTPVREALLLLASEGLVDMGSGRGSRATVRIHDAEELAVIYDMRALLEGYATGRAVHRITPDELRELEESCDRMGDGTSDTRAYVAENQRFHSLLLRAAGDDRLSSIVQRLLQIPMAYKDEFWAVESNRRLTLEGHRRVVKALRTKDPEKAENAMRRHLSEVGEARDALTARATARFAAKAGLSTAV